MKIPRTILIIDDNDDNRYTFGRYLKKAGFEVMEATSGEEGLKKAKEGPDLVMLDIQLGDMTGFDVCQKIKSDNRTASIPVLHTSATFTESSDRAFGLVGGADGYLVAPIDPDELLATVNALLRVRQAEASAKRLAQQWETTFNAITDGVCLLNTHGIIERSNKSMREIFKLDDLNHVSFVTTLRNAELNPSFFERSFGQEPSFSSRVEIHKKIYQFAINPVATDHGAQEGYACVFSDITASVQAESSLKRQNDELEDRVMQRTSALNEANAQLESFVYSIAHDLRAPIRSMKGYSDALIDDYSSDLQEDAKKYLTRISTNAQKMDHLIQDLLKFSRISRQEIVLEDVNLLACIKSAISDADANLEKSIDVFSIDIPSDLTVRAHYLTLQQAIANLLSNSVKFVGKGVEPSVKIFASQSAGKVRLGIRDNGIGIDPKYHEKIFKVFERINLNYNGTGIGLAIVKRAMERLSGFISVESHPMAGTTFWIELAAGKP